MRRGLPSTANETGISSGVGKSQQAVLEKIPRARNEDAAAQQAKGGLHKKRSRSWFSMATEIE